MAAAVGSLGMLFADFMEAREEANLQRKVERYERLQELMIKRLDFYIEDGRQVRENLAIAERTIASAKSAISKYEDIVVPSWEEGVKGLRAQIAELTQANQAAEVNIQSLKGELLRAQDKVEELKGLYGAAMTMARDLKASGDGFEVQSKAAQAQVASLEQVVQRKTKSLDTFRTWHASNLALRCALEMQLLRADPDNPLLQDQDLRERVRRGGAMAVSMLGEDSVVDPFDMARETGLTFDVPGRPSGVQVLSELALTEVYMRRLAFLHADGEDAMKALQKIQLGHGTMSAARDLLKQMDPGSDLLKPQTTLQVQEMAMDEFQRHQQERRLQSKGASTAWSAAVSGQQTVRQRAVHDLEYLIEESAPDVPH